jgi:hypothetical protein
MADETGEGSQPEQAAPTTPLGGENEAGGISVIKPVPGEGGPRLVPIVPRFDAQMPQGPAIPPGRMEELHQEVVAAAREASGEQDEHPVTGLSHVDTAAVMELADQMAAKKLGESGAGRPATIPLTDKLAADIGAGEQGTAATGKLSVASFKKVAGPMLAKVFGTGAGQAPAEGSAASPDANKPDGTTGGTGEDTGGAPTGGQA